MVATPYSFPKSEIKLLRNLNNKARALENKSGQCHGEEFNKIQKIN